MPRWRPRSRRGSRSFAEQINIGPQALEQFAGIHGRADRFQQAPFSLARLPPAATAAIAPSNGLRSITSSPSTPNPARDPRQTAPAGRQFGTSHMVALSGVLFQRRNRLKRGCSRGSRDDAVIRTGYLQRI